MSKQASVKMLQRYVCLVVFQLSSFYLSREVSYRYVLLPVKILVCELS